MEKNTVLLDLDKYNELNTFYEGIKRGDFVRISDYDSEIYCIKKSDLVDSLNRDVRILKVELDKCKRLENMSIKEIKKWRKQNK